VDGSRARQLLRNKLEDTSNAGGVAELLCALDCMPLAKVRGMMLVSFLVSLRQAEQQRQVETLFVSHRNDGGCSKGGTNCLCWSPQNSLQLTFSCACLASAQLIRGTPMAVQSALNRDTPDRTAGSSTTSSCQAYTECNIPAYTILKTARLLSKHTVQSFTFAISTPLNAGP
jgi:hypothetical protein